jgi:hypothetical protein
MLIERRPMALGVVIGALSWVAAQVVVLAQRAFGQPPS